MAATATAFALLLITVPFSASSFVVTPGPTRVELYGNNALLVYHVNPWPPPNKINNTLYETVYVTYSNLTSQSDICRLEFHKGVLRGPKLCDPRVDTYSPPDYLPNLNISTVTFYDIGEYRLNVSYGFDDSFIGDVRLEVQASPLQPTISKSPDRDLNTGEDVDFFCSSIGANPPADVRWLRNGILAGDQRRHKAENWRHPSSANYTRRKVNFFDHGSTYQCEAANTVGRASKSFFLQVRHEPRVQIPPCVQVGRQYKLIEGNDAKLTCEFSAYPVVDRVQWFRGTDNLNTNVTSLTLRNVLRTDPRTYSCRVQNDVGPKDASCTLDVQYGAQPILPQNLTFNEGESFNISCDSDANPAAHAYKWRRKTPPTQTVDGQFLARSNIGPDDAGVYRCEATNELSPTYGNKQQWTGSADITLFINFSPRLSWDALTKFTGRTGQPATLKCRVRAYPEIEFTWSFRGTVLKTGRGHQLEHDTFESTHHIASVKDSDLGDYTCSTRNTQQSTFTIQLLRPGRPDPPIQCEQINVTSRSTALRCLPGYNGGESVTFSAEKHGPGVTPGGAPVTTSWTGSLAVLVIHRLVPNTNYTLHIFAHNRHGRSDKAYKAYVNTADGPTDPPPVPPNVGAIVGGVFGGFLVVLLVALIVVARARYGPPDWQKIKERVPVPESVKRWNEERKERKERRESDPLRKKKAGLEDYDSPYIDSLSKTVQVGKGYGKGAIDRQHSVPNEYIKVHGHVNKAYADHAETPLDSRLPTSGAGRDGANLIGQGAMGGANRYSATRPMERPYEDNAYENIHGEDEFEFPRERLVIQNKLGEGCFGEVWRALADGIAGRKGRSFVAVKMLKLNSPNEERRTLLRELDTMKMLRPHQNIIRLLGCCAEHEPVYILMEYASNGNLQDFLRRNRVTGGATYGRPGPSSQTLTSNDLTTFALHVASGMDYISSKELLHRDLAARNVLVTSRLECKISDFGFARDIVHSRQYESKVQRRLPIRWMAPECLYDNIFTVKSDVWSFGVLLWEIVTLGSSPYPGMSGPDVMELVQMGYRMDKPRNCSDAMFALMHDCWRHDPSRRPSFQLLCEKLSAILDDPANDLDLGQIKENMYEILNNLPGEKC